jgi:hypothetical protein
MSCEQSASSNDELVKVEYAFGVDSQQRIFMRE